MCPVDEMMVSMPVYWYMDCNAPNILVLHEKLAPFPPGILCICIVCACYQNTVANFSRYIQIHDTVSHTYKITPPTPMFGVQSDCVSIIFLHCSIGVLNLEFNYKLDCCSLFSNSIFEYNVLGSKVSTNQVVLESTNL